MEEVAELVVELMVHDESAVGVVMEDVATLGERHSGGDDGGDGGGGMSIGLYSVGEQNKY